MGTSTQGSDGADPVTRRWQSLPDTLRARYEGSFAQDLARGLGAVDFGDRILNFGASLLLSVLPLIIVLSAFASHRIDDDITTHLVLNTQGDRSFGLDSGYSPPSISPPPSWTTVRPTTRSGRRSRW